MGRSFWAQKGHLALAPGPPALALARPILGTRTNEKLPYGSFSFVSGPGFPNGWDPAVEPFNGFLRLSGLNCWLFLAPPGGSQPVQFHKKETAM